MKITFTLTFVIWILQIGIAQEPIDSFLIIKEDAPRYNIFRAKENYEYLKNPDKNPFAKNIFDPIKYIAISKDKKNYLSIGGELRPRLEHFSNRKWKSENVTFYSQRLSFHSNVVIGKYFRIFAELFQGLTSIAKPGPDYDKLNFHQLFIEFPIHLENDNKVALIFGRQELAFGTSRLVTLREGPNVRQDFDLIRANIDLGELNMQLFYGKEVRTQPEVFDNSFAFFDSNANNAQLWGAYSQFQLKGLTGSNELYYIGFHSDMVALSDVQGEETRHTVGLRRFGIMGGRWRYNTELIYQFGDNDGNSISAYNIETDWSYNISPNGWQTSPGIKLVYSSGDKNLGDGKLGTFNSLYVSPNVYNLASTLVPINLISVHPLITIKPNNKLKLFLEYVLFWRTSTNDNVYGPPGVILRRANNTVSKYLGSQMGLNLDYSFNRHFSFNLNTSYYITDAFQEATGSAENIFHIAPTLSFKF